MKIYCIYYITKDKDGLFDVLDTYGDCYASSEEAQKQIEKYKQEPHECKDRVYIIRELYMNIFKMAELGIIHPL